MAEFIFPLRVYIEDTDMMGVVYHANYFNYFARARSEWAEQTGFGIDWQNAQEIYFPVHSAKIEYLKPALLHQCVEVVSQIKETRRASLVYDQYLRPAGLNDTILCKAEIKIACVGKDLRPRALPDIFTRETQRDY